MEQDTRNNWSIETIWNELLTEETVLHPRSYIRASEIGQPFLDRYLKMKAVPYSNPYSARILRVFDAGKIFETEVVERIFKLLGIFIESQTEIQIYRDGLLPVVGHHDPLVGGKIDKFKALHRLYEEDVSEWMRKRAEALLNKLLLQYPNGMKVLMTEIKTVNSLAFFSPKNRDPKTRFFKGYDHHKLQLWTYLRPGEEGRILYISKDDLTLKEVTVLKNDKSLEKLWLNDIKKMSHYWDKNQEPPAEPSIVFNEERGIYNMNWRIKRSNYFTKITGFQNHESWEAYYNEEIKKKNTALCSSCKKPFSLETLNKNAGVCGRCIKVINSKKEGGVIENGSKKRK